MPIVELGEAVVLLRNGASIKQSEYAGGIPITRIETIADWSINPERCGYADVSEGDFPNHILQKGDILISHINSTKHLGKCAIYKGIPEKLIHGMNLLGLRVNVDIAYPDYIFRVLSSQVFRQQLPRITKDSVNQSSFTVPNFKALKIPLPPLKEQKRIAAILDKADAICRKRQQAIDLTDQLLRSVFLDMFGDPVTNPKGWDKVELQYVVSDVIDCPHTTPRWTESGKVAIRTSNLTVGGWKWDDKRYVSEDEYHDRSKRAYVESGDIVLSREGTVGIAAIVQEGMEICLGQRLVQLKPNFDIANSEYILHILLYELEPERLERVMVGATSKHLNVKELRSLNIPVPPKDFQDKFKEIANKISKRRALLVKTIEVEGGLFSSLTQQAFNGELSSQTKAA